MGGFPNSNAAVVDLFPDFGVPIALFEYDVSGLDVVFLDLSEFASPTQINQWHWSLGDGNSVSSDQAFAQHSYAEGGEYVVSLVVKDIYGQLSEPFTEIILIEPGDAPVVGDMNDDSILDILDIVVLVNLVIDNPGFDSQGDINNDGILNVLDVILLVNLLLE
jgi:PKD repeat protein